jgi:hypothetical protein
VEDYSTETTAKRLGVSPKTIESHQYLAYKVLGMNNRAEIARLYTAMQERPKMDSMESAEDTQGSNFFGN